MFCIEFSLQVRTHIRFGRSVLNAARGQETTVYNDEFGLRLLRPNSLVEGSLARIITNSIGLRSPEISAVPSKDEARLAVVGASTVMGAYAERNQDTFSYMLEDHLRRSFPGHKTHVINAGIAGNSMLSHLRMIRHVVLPLQPSVIILYPGQNDISGYCRQAVNLERSNGAIRDYRLPAVSLPSWLLSHDLLIKNTMWLRERPAGRNDVLAIGSIDPSLYRLSLEQIVELTKSAGVELVLATSSRAYRRDMPLAEQLRLSETARYYNDCYDLPGLHDAMDFHNEIVRQIANQYDVPLIDLAIEVPGGSEYFADSSHFSYEGEELVARLLFEFMETSKILEELYGD